MEKEERNGRKAAKGDTPLQMSEKDKTCIMGKSKTGAVPPSASTNILRRPLYCQLQSHVGARAPLQGGSRRGRRKGAPQGLFLLSVERLSSAPGRKMVHTPPALCPVRLAMNQEWSFARLCAGSLLSWVLVVITSGGTAPVVFTFYFYPPSSLPDAQHQSFLHPSRSP